ncbi:TniQ family protein [Fredinandcohnia sp. FSL W7-1320]|uniref:TniQ family protein n=1 Tax=Fredinandcohnia sp. FSL W7-1320 TaxID=2954540 RepID=UPI0030FD9804
MTVTGGGLYKSTASLNGIKSGAFDLVKVLEKLTLRNDLMYTTMLTWSEVLPTRGLLRAKKAWCPICLEEWKTNEEPIYEPLLWFIKEVKVCAKHKIKLETSCPSCRNEIPIISRNTRHGYCTDCGHWLGKENNYFTKLDEEGYYLDLWKANVIGELLENMPSIKTFPDRSRIKNALKIAVEECTAGVANKFAEMANIPKSTFKSYFVNNLPSISRLLIISFCSGVTLNQFLITQLSKITFTVRLIHFKSDVEHIGNNRFPDGYIEKQLLNWANSLIYPPPSLREIALLIGCDRRLLYKNSPELSKIISQKYLDYISERSKERIENAKKRVVEAVNTLNSKGIYPSRRKVEDFLEMPGVIKEEAVRITWFEELKKINQEIKQS